jgi:hypothetical protein
VSSGEPVCSIDCDPVDPKSCAALGDDFFCRAADCDRTSRVAICMKR